MKGDSCRSHERGFARCARLGSLLAILPVAAALGFSTGDQILAERRDRIDRMEPEEKEQLLRKLERFHKLSPEEQDRLRALDAAIRADAQQEELRQVVERYHQWLSERSTAERAELMRLAVPERLERISELRREEAEQAARRLAPEDVAAFKLWLESLQIELLPQAVQTELRKLEGLERSDRLREELRKHGRWFNLFDPASLDEKKLARLRHSISPTAYSQWESATEEEKQKLFRTWLWQAYPRNWSRAWGQPGRPAASAEKEAIKKIWHGLPESKKREFRQLPPDQMQWALWRQYVDGSNGHRRGPGEPMRRSRSSKPSGRPGETPEP